MINCNHKEDKNYILCGMYDKTCVPHEKSLLYDGVVPDNVKKFPLFEKDMYYQTVLRRKDFPFRKPNGDEQVYFGWFILVPVDKTLLTINENHSVSLDVNMLNLNKTINHKGVDYKIYGKFNVSKLSDNWSIIITLA